MKKIDAGATEVETQEEETLQNEDDYNILFPDIKVNVVYRSEGDEEPVKDVITAREFTFSEMLEAQHLGRGIIAHIADQLHAGERAELRNTLIEEAIGLNAEAWHQMVRTSTGLSDTKLEMLTLNSAATVSRAVWQANSIFFIPKIIQETQSLRMIEASLSQSDESLTNSSDPDTGDAPAIGTEIPTPDLNTDQWQKT